MSYDLYFWREERTLRKTPDEIRRMLTDDATVAGVATFPRSTVRQRFRDALPAIVDNDVGMDWEGAGSYFQVGFNHSDEKSINCIIVTCGYQLLKSPDTMNLILGVANSLGCALYDPQTGQRYQQPEGRQ